MSRAAGLLVLAYGLMLCAVGAAGILGARWELAAVFDVDLGNGGIARSTFLNQYRFLKAVELGAGAFCLLLRQPILAGGPAARAFLVLVAGGVAARSLAWAADGRPSWPFALFLALEAIVLAVFLTHLSRQHG